MDTSDYQESINNCRFPNILEYEIIDGILVKGGNILINIDIITYLTDIN